jgi:hypothetical protein
LRDDTKHASKKNTNEATMIDDANNWTPGPPPAGLLSAALGVPVDRVFTSQACGIVSGIEPAKQKLWRSRALVRFEMERPSHRREFTFDDLLRWSLCGEALRLGIQIEEASHVVLGAFGKPLGGAFPWDQRTRPDGDLFALIRFRPGEPESYANLSTFSGQLSVKGRDASAFLGRQAHILNVSEWQRVFAARFLTL